MFHRIVHNDNLQKKYSYGAIIPDFFLSFIHFLACIQ